MKYGTLRNNMWIKDSKGEKSVTVTVLVSVVGVALAKLLVSGITYKGMSFGVFSGSDFSLVAGAAFTFYWSRRNMTIGNGEK